MALSQINQTFDPLADAEKLHKAMKGLGTDEKAIIDVMAHRPSHQRAEIAKAFKTSYGKDLKSAFKSELSGNFHKVCKGLCDYLCDYDAACIRRAIKGAGTDEDALVDIMSMRNNHQIRAIKASYSQKFRRDMEADVRSDVSGDFSRVLIGLMMANRDESTGPVNPEIVTKDVQALYEAGEKRMGTEESTFNRIMCTRSLPHIAAVSAEYARSHKRSLKDAISSETSGNYRNLLLSIWLHVATLLYHSMRGIGTNDRRLQRVIISQCESDLPAIKAAFQRLHSKGLGDMIRSDTSGDYRKVLLALIGEA
uniref:Annexin n=1 Tax=Macrostomum lignano TaxID=282301 RepID=A0A1I8IUY5_9PLAT